MIDYTNMPIPEPRELERRHIFGRQTGEVRALFHGHTIAASDRALAVRDGDGATTYYFPEDCVETAVLRPNDRAAPRDPLMGDPVWFTLYRDGEILEDGAWAYPAPAAGAEQICGMIAFNPEHVEIELDAVAAAGESPVIDDYIRHTDSGSGRSQEAPWSPTVGRPGDQV